MLKKLFVLFLALILLGGCAPGRQNNVLTRTEFLMDTFVTITLYGSRDEDALNSAFDLCRHFNYMFSRHSPLSELYRLNNADGQPVTVSPELARLLEIAVYYSSLSGGLLDITIAPVMDLWFDDHHDDAPRTPPSTEDIPQALALVDYRNIIISGDTVTLKNGAMIDLGGIAKGYIADEIGRYLLERGVTSAIINLGGDVLVIGGRPDGNPFRIGIRKPFETPREIMGVVTARDSAIFTSGVYERYFIHE
ncbi:MAG: FAD:protein FMN transferase, partial [Defluviitaleaceae bacterium]|nr:FAD:protein FMN transferase [Defluviitaleaceae bacterium]